jgi:replication factor C small subunit
MSSKNLIWVEDYRPKTVEECILPDRIKNVLRNMVKEKNIQNYSAVGLPGSGKTSSARALCEELGIEYLIINMSKESGIDTVRNKIVSYASSLSFTSDYKVIITEFVEDALEIAKEAEEEDNFDILENLDITEDI